MKKAVVYLSLVFLSVASCTTKTSVEEVLDAPAKEKVEVSEEKAPVNENATAQLSIEGMSCMINCVSSVKKELKKTEGVGNVEVDFDPDRSVDKATIKYDNTVISENEIKAVIEKVNGGQYKIVTNEEEVNETDSIPSSGGGSGASLMSTFTQFFTSELEIPSIFQLLKYLY